MQATFTFSRKRYDDWVRAVAGESMDHDFNDNLYDILIADRSKFRQVESGMYNLRAIDGDKEVQQALRLYIQDRIADSVWVADPSKQRRTARFISLPERPAWMLQTLVEIGIEADVWHVVNELEAGLKGDRVPWWEK